MPSDVVGLLWVDFCFSNWDKLQGIIAKSWKAEKVEEFVETATRSRIELLHNAQVGDCTCGGQWATFARTILNQNGHDPAAQALASGRSKGNLVTHPGLEEMKAKVFSSAHCRWCMAKRTFSSLRRKVLSLYLAWKRLGWYGLTTGDSMKT